MGKFGFVSLCKQLNDAEFHGRTEGWRDGETRSSILFSVLINGPISSYMVMYGHMWSCMVLYGHVLSMVMHIGVW